MKIDLHCHTLSTKKGDGCGRNVTPEVFRSKIEMADVKIVAITNHNLFDIKQYNTLKTAVEDICLVWPGIEIDAIGTSDRFHLLVICSPDDIVEFDKKTKLLFCGEDINSCVHSLEEVCLAYNNCNAIYIPHFHNKRPAISEEDRDRLIALVKDPARVFIEPRDHRTLGVLISNDFNAIIGSDVKDWAQYERSTFAELRLPIGSFSEFLLLSRRDAGVVKTLLCQKPPIVVVGKPHASVQLNLEIFPDVNIIFGQKGTGKSEILASLYEAMIKDGHSCKKYIASENNEDFSTLLSAKEMQADLGKLHANLCDDEFLYLKKWSDRNPLSLSAYVNWINTKGNSGNKTRMKITEAVHEVFRVDAQFNNHKQDKESVEEAIKAIRSIELTHYIKKTESVELLNLLTILESSILSKRKEDLVNEKAIKLVNYTIDKIKSLADRYSDTVSRPSTAGLVEFAECRISLYKAVKRILQSLAQPEFNERVLLGTLEGKGKVYINRKYRMLCPLSRTDEFSSHGIRKLRDIHSLLLEIAENVFSQEVAASVDRLNKMCVDNNVTSVKPFLGLSKQIVTEDGEEYQPSTGEKGILLLQQTLKEDAEAYFLDEPELGMGNSYIDTDIRPLISNLAKQRKYVVVATHNANIAVRTLPYTSIFRTHENGEYKTYIGNPFDDRLTNLVDPNDTRSWTEESMHSLEGSKEAFYERRDIYESKSD